jgi:hypothetical protein
MIERNFGYDEDPRVFRCEVSVTVPLGTLPRCFPELVGVPVSRAAAEAARNDDGEDVEHHLA